MNRRELRQTLVAEGFRPSSYSLTDGHADEALCLRQDGGSWVVYYSERGLETGKVSFGTEAQACQYHLELMRRDPTTKASWKSGWSGR